jgi:hypothetical protein
MLVFWKAKLVLLAVPKTGTTALEAAFGPWADGAFFNPPRLKHMTLRRYRRQLAPILAQDGPPLEVMAVMREPVDWLSSWYRYRTRPELGTRPQSTAGLSFGDFALAWLGTIRRNTPGSVGNRGSCRSPMARPGSITCSATTGWRRCWISSTTAFRRGPGSTGTTPRPPRGRTAGSDADTRALLRQRAPEDFTMWDDLCAARP